MGRDSTGPDDWSNARVKTAYREARAVLDAQQRSLADIDDKATRAVRITVLLLGGLISIAQLANGVFHRWLALCGGVSLLLSLGFGVAAYHESALLLGPSGSFFDELTRSPPTLDSRWDIRLVDSYAGFVDSNERDIEFSGNLLFGQQVFLVEGMLLFGLAIIV